MNCIIVTQKNRMRIGIWVILLLGVLGEAKINDALDRVISKDRFQKFMSKTNWSKHEEKFSSLEGRSVMIDDDSYRGAHQQQIKGSRVELTAFSSLSKQTKNAWDKFKGMGKDIHLRAVSNVKRIDQDTYQNTRRSINPSQLAQHVPQTLFAAITDKHHRGFTQRNKSKRGKAKSHHHSTHSNSEWSSDEFSDVGQQQSGGNQYNLINKIERTIMNKSRADEITAISKKSTVDLFSGLDKETAQSIKKHAQYFCQCSLNGQLADAVIKFMTDDLRAAAVKYGGNRKKREKVVAGIAVVNTEIFSILKMSMNKCLKAVDSASHIFTQAQCKGFKGRFTSTLNTVNAAVLMIVGHLPQDYIPILDLTAQKTGRSMRRRIHELASESSVKVKVSREYVKEVEKNGVVTTSEMIPNEVSKTSTPRNFRDQRPKGVTSVISTHEGGTSINDQVISKHFGDTNFPTKETTEREQIKSSPDDTHLYHSTSFEFPAPIVSIGMQATPC